MLAGEQKGRPIAIINIFICAIHIKYYVMHRCYLELHLLPETK